MTHYAVRGRFDYLQCAECLHVFISQENQGEFGQAFYTSPAYKALEAQWPQSERLHLFKNVLSEAERCLGRPVRDLLDFGAGSEDLSEKRELAPGVVFYDPHYARPDAEPLDPRRQFDCVVLTEVLEHVFDPVAVLRKIRGHSTLCIATTLLHDLNFNLRYLEPDFGHVSIYSQKSIAAAAAAAAFKHRIVFWPGQYTYYYHLFEAVDPLKRPVFPGEEPARARRAANPLLEGPPQRHFSQNDEDGILLEILRRIGHAGPSTFLELGVDTGLENNTLVLLARKWRGAWLGGQDLAFEPRGRLSFEKCWITRGEVVAQARRALDRLGLSLAEVAVVSIDLDGNDHHILSELLRAGLRADVIIVEYNAKFPPLAEFVMPYEEGHQWSNDDYFGASLHSWVKLLGGDYRLVACNATGANAFFVRHEFAASFSDVPDREEDLFRAGAYQTIPRSGHPPSVRTIAEMIGDGG